MFAKRSFFRKTSVLITFAALGMLWGDIPTDFLGETGCLPLTDEEFLHLDTFAHKVVEILPNALAAQRMPGKKAAKKQYPEEHVKQGTISEALSSIPLAASLPSSVDNSQLPSFPPIGFQGSLGACTAFATT